MITLTVALLCLASAAVIVWAVLPTRSPIQSRLVRITGSDAKRTATDSENVRREKDSSIVTRVLSRVGVGTKLVDDLGIVLRRASISIPAGTFVLFGGLASIASAILIYTFVFRSAGWAALVGLVATFAACFLLLARRRDRNVAMLVAQLPEALDLIVRGVRSGLPLSEAISVAAVETTHPIAQFFQDSRSLMAIGRPVEEAVANEAKRVGVRELTFFAVSVSIQQDTGGNLAEVLENLSTMVRRRQQLKLRIAAMSAEARSSAGIIAALPFIVGAVIWIVSPDYLGVLLEDERGTWILASAVSSVMVGVSIMARLARFDI